MFFSVSLILRLIHSSLASHVITFLVPLSLRAKCFFRSGFTKSRVLSALLLCNNPNLTVAILDLPKSTDEIIILYIWVILCPSLLVRIKMTVEKNRHIFCYYSILFLKCNRAKMTTCNVTVSGWESGNNTFSSNSMRSLKLMFNQKVTGLIRLGAEHFHIVLQ